MKDLNSISNSWQTPPKLFDELSKKYGPFDIDLAATKENSKCKDYYSDYLKDVWANNKSKHTIKELLEMHFPNLTCWLNPPYSNPLPFIEKAWRDSVYCKIVLLVKVDPSTKWWSVFWDYGNTFKCQNCHKECQVEKDAHREHMLWSECCFDWVTRLIGPKSGAEVHFLPKRVQFDPPKEMNAWKEKVECKDCDADGSYFVPPYSEFDEVDCDTCDGKGYKEGNKWCVKCSYCMGIIQNELGMVNGSPKFVPWTCSHCKGTGVHKLTGPSFASAVIIMDRRNV